MSQYRIALNATAAATGGGLTYWINILPSLIKVAPENEFLLLVSDKQTKLSLDFPENVKVEAYHFASTAHRLLWEQFKLPIILKKKKIDVLLSPADTTPIFSHCPSVMAIRNILPYSNQLKIGFKSKIYWSTLRLLSYVSSIKASHVFFVSKESREQITPHLAIAESATSVIYHGVSNIFLKNNPNFESAIGTPKEKFILSVSALYAHKDFETLIKAFAQLKNRSEYFKEHKLVIVGALVNKEYVSSLELLIKSLGIESAVEFTGELPYQELPALYQKAEVFVFPSRAETFGHPLVEAMSSGVPIISSNLSIAQEVCEDAALYFPIGDSNELAKLLEELCNDTTLRQKLIKNSLIRAKQFSWEHCAKETLELLENVAAKANSLQRLSENKI
jgi:glycosyltransferase involved in cell wall biosynthesis